VDLQFISGAIMSLFGYALIAGAGYKLYQISRDVSEVREMLREMKRDAQHAAMMNPNSPEQLVRAVNAASYSEIESSTD
jgi:hypothetical protein